MRVQTLLAFLLGLGVGAHVSRPSTSSFDRFFEKWMSEQLNRAGEESSTSNLVRWLNNSVGSIASRLTSALSQVRFQTYPVAVVAYIKVPGIRDELVFLGAFNTWFPLVAVQVE